MESTKLRAEERPSDYSINKIETIAPTVRSEFISSVSPRLSRDLFNLLVVVENNEDTLCSEEKTEQYISWQASLCLLESWILEHLDILEKNWHRHRHMIIVGSMITKHHTTINHIAAMQ
jgi:hypothetical protein